MQLYIRGFPYSVELFMRVKTSVMNYILQVRIPLRRLIYHVHVFAKDPPSTTVLGVKPSPKQH